MRKSSEASSISFPLDEEDVLVEEEIEEEEDIEEDIEVIDDEEENSDDEEEIDFEDFTVIPGCLDMTSSHFDPLAALSAMYEGESTDDGEEDDENKRKQRTIIKLPVPNATPLENFGRMRFLIPVELQPQLSKPLVEGGHGGSASKRTFGDDALRMNMRIKKINIIRVAAQRRVKVLKRFQANIKGPLSLLSQSVKEKSRVRVHVRRGGCKETRITGVVEAFDRHFSMLLSQVEETVINLDDTINRAPYSNLFIRGDNVIEVARIRKASDSQ